MILSALAEYYDRLPEVAPPGWAPRGASFCLVLEIDGRLHSCKDIRLEEEERKAPRQLIVPHPGGKRTSAIRPYLLCDKTEYLLGRDDKKESEEDPEKREKNLERMAKAFGECKALHGCLRERIDSPEYEAVYAFLRNWVPSKAEELLPWAEVTGTNLVFSIRGQTKYVHEVPLVRTAWEASLSTNSGVVLPSLLDGHPSPVALTHMSIKGVRGGKPEQSIIAFNKDKDAFGSYGKQQGLNAPLGEQDAFRYCTALNALLADDRRKVQIGDATTVFWSARPHPIEDITGAILAGTEDEGTVRRVGAFLTSLKRGAPDETLKETHTPFFVLGLASNASRLAVRFWLKCTVGDFAHRIRQHASALELDGAPQNYPFPAIWSIVLETAPAKRNGWPDEKHVSPILAGEVARAILLGLPYPRSLLARIVERLRAEGVVIVKRKKPLEVMHQMHRRASIVKGCLVRGALNSNREIPMTLNEDHTEVAYQLGRLFAILERTQLDAFDRQINRTIRDGYISSASASPVTVFPRLLRLAQHHIAKLPDSREEAARRRAWMRVTAERRIAEVMDRISAFPTHLPIERQGLFFLGYYQQRQDLYTKKKDADAVAADA